MKFKNLTLSYFAGLFAVLFLLNVQTVNGQISVVVAKSSTYTANGSEIKEIFLGARLMWPNGSKILVIDQPDTETGKTFYSKFLGKPVAEVRMQWTKLVLSGQISAPIKSSDDEAVKRNLGNNPNSIGFISTKSLDSSVKELFRIE